MAKSMMMAMMEMTMETMVLVAASFPSPLSRLLVLHSVCPPLGLSQLVEFSRWHWLRSHASRFLSAPSLQCPAASHQ